MNRFLLEILDSYNKLLV